MSPDPEAVIAALAPQLGDERRATIAKVAERRLGGLVVVLEKLHDPHNGGAALRSCEAVGVREVHVVGGPLRFAERVTQGCHKWLDLVHHPSIEASVAALRGRGLRLYAAVPGAPVTLAELDPLAPAAFLVGNEHEGLSAAARAACDVEFAIPLAGFSQSVNLSVATALVVYTHAARRRAALGQDGDLAPGEVRALIASYYVRDVRGARAILAARGVALPAGR